MAFENGGFPRVKAIPFKPIAEELDVFDILSNGGGWIEG